MNLSKAALRPAQTQLPKPLCEDTPDILTVEPMPVVQRFFHLVVGELAGGFAGSPVDLSRQVLNITEACYDCREFVRRMAKAFWLKFIDDLSSRAANDSSPVPTSP